MLNNHKFIIVLIIFIILYTVCECHQVHSSLATPTPVPSVKQQSNSDWIQLKLLLQSTGGVSGWSSSIIGSSPTFATIESSQNRLGWGILNVFSGGDGDVNRPDVCSLIRMDDDSIYLLYICIFKFNINFYICNV